MSTSKPYDTNIIVFGKTTSMYIIYIYPISTGPEQMNKMVK